MPGDGVGGRLGVRQCGHRGAGSPGGDAGEESLTYGELHRQANQMGHVLAGFGVGRGDRVVTWSDNNLESVALFVALARFKHPRRIEAMDAIPRTPATNQVRRRDVLEAILASSPRRG